MVPQDFWQTTKGLLSFIVWYGELVTWATSLLIAMDVEHHISDHISLAGTARGHEIQCKYVMDGPLLFHISFPFENGILPHCSSKVYMRCRLPHRCSHVLVKFDHFKEVESRFMVAGTTSVPNSSISLLVAVALARPGSFATAIRFVMEFQLRSQLRSAQSKSQWSWWASLRGWLLLGVLISSMKQNWGCFNFLGVS